MKDFEQMAHTADLQIRVYGTTLSELFLHAMQGMFQSIKPYAHGCIQKNDRLVCANLNKEHTFEERASDSVSLLVNFLSTVLYLSDVHNEAYLDAHIHELSDTYIKVTVYGVVVTGFDTEIKAVTYHDLSIEYVHDMWQADIIFDV